MTACVGCGAALTKRHQAIYCSDACQRTVERRLKTLAWLESGQAVVLGGSRRPYIRLCLYEQ